MEIIILIIIAFVFIGFIASLFDGNDKSTIKTNVKIMTDKEEKEYWDERGGKPWGNTPLFGSPNTTTNSDNQCNCHALVNWKYFTNPNDLYRGSPVTKRVCKGCGKRDYDYIS